MISKNKRVIEKPEFGTFFVYNGNTKKGIVEVRRIGEGDLLQTIKFWGGDGLKTYEEFKDVCTTWIDQNLA